MCKIIADTKKITHEEWLELRKQGIGGSDAGAVCGLDPYSSPMKVFRDKTGGTTVEAGSEAARQGHDLEGYVAGLECKTANAYNADKWKDGKIPLHYVVQCYHYMAVTGKKAWYIAALILGMDFVYYRLEWDDVLISQLVETEKNFWLHYVEAGRMPGPDGSACCNEVLQQYYHTAKKGSAMELHGLEEKLTRREEILAQIEGLKREQGKIEQEVKMQMKEHETAVSGKYRISWGNVDTARFDTKKFKEDEPELYQRYAKVSSSRRFQIRAA